MEYRTEDNKNNYKKKYCLEVIVFLVRKENPEKEYVLTLFRKIIMQLKEK